MLHGDEKRHVVRQLVAGTRKMLTDENDAKITLSNSSNLKKNPEICSWIKDTITTSCTLHSDKHIHSPLPLYKKKSQQQNKIDITCQKKQKPFILDILPSMRKHYRIMILNSKVFDHNLIS